MEGSLCGITSLGEQIWNFRYTATGNEKLTILGQISKHAFHLKNDWFFMIETVALKWIKDCRKIREITNLCVFTISLNKFKIVPEILAI